MRNRVPLEFIVLALLSLLSLAGPADAADERPVSEDSHHVNLLTGEGVSLGKIFSPEVNFQTAFGSERIHISKHRVFPRGAVHAEDFRLRDLRDEDRLG
jgi:hypothetical protein